MTVSVIHKHVFLNGYAFTDLFFDYYGEKYQSRVLGTLGHYDIGQQLSMFAERRRLEKFATPRIIPQWPPHSTPPSSS